jgi:hypothetical protein
MKKVFASVIALAGFMASPASAQIVFQPGIFQNPLVLVENQDVQTDLKLSEEQAKKIVELSRSYAESLRGVGFQDVEKRKKANDAAVKGLSDVLAAEQTKRLRQLEVQQRGANLFLDQQVVKELAITPPQRNAIIKALQAVGPKQAAMFQAAKGNQKEIQKKLADLQREIVPSLVKNLSKEQQAKWQQIAGPTFAGAFTFNQPIFVDPRPQPVLAWHMNDLAAAQVESRKTGKPIFVTFRCEA